MTHIHITYINIKETTYCRDQQKKKVVKKIAAEVCLRSLGRSSQSLGATPAKARLSFEIIFDHLVGKSDGEADFNDLQGV